MARAHAVVPASPCPLRALDAADYHRFHLPAPRALLGTPRAPDHPLPACGLAAEAPNLAALRPRGGATDGHAQRAAHRNEHQPTAARVGPRDGQKNRSRLPRAPRRRHPTGLPCQHTSHRHRPRHLRRALLQGRPAARPPAPREKPPRGRVARRGYL